MQFFINLLETTLIYLIIGYSFKIIYDCVKFFHFAHAISLTVAAYLTYMLAIQLNLPFVVAIFLAVVSTIGLMLLVYFLIYSSLLKREAESWQLLIASLGIYMVLQNVVSLIWGDQILSFRIWPIKQGHRFFGAYITDVQIVSIATGILLLLLAWWIIERTSIGYKIKGVSSNPELSGLLGIAKDKVLVWSFIIGSGLAAFVGIVIAASTDMTPTMGFNWLLYGVIVMIISGMGKMLYLLLGALFLASSQHLVAYYMDSKWMNAVTYSILIIFLYFRPYGFSGRTSKKVEI